MEFKQVASLLSDAAVDQHVCIRGWVYRKSIVGKKAFIRVRDSSGVIQVVIDSARLGEHVIGDLEETSLEASVSTCGKVKKSERAPGGYELEADYFTIIGPSRDFPIKGGEGVDYLLDIRHLWIRSPLFTKVFKIKHTVLKAGRDYFNNNGWWEVTPPILTSSACEGGATLFPVDYFGSKAYLSQSAQLYLEVLIYVLEKVWSLTPSFRAERSRTRRHLAEYWHLEPEAAWYDMNDMMKVAEELVSYIIERILEERMGDLVELNRNIEVLKKSANIPYPRMKYDEAIEILQKKGIDVKWGDDLGADEEKILTSDFETPIFLTHFPKNIKSFYMKIDSSRPDVVLGFDLLAPEGYGEIIGGGQREDSYDILYKRM
ncbi:MAG: asparagine--tRNA ligase, partial [Desulfurococcaceae archaeon]